MFTFNSEMFFDKRNCCSDIAQGALMLLMDGKKLKRKWIFKVNKSISKRFFILLY